MTATDLRYIDSDGHILEHPTGMLDYESAVPAPRAHGRRTRAHGDR